MTAKHAKLSFVIPAYNYAHTLARAVHSICNQMDADTELLIVNDGSTDHTAQVLTDLQKTLGDKIKVFHKSNGGSSSSRNFGIAQASGNYLVFLDADDELADDAIAHIRQHLAQQPDSQFIIGGHISVLSNGKRKQHTPKAVPEQALNRLKAYLIDKELSISNGACLMHRAIFAQHLYPEHFRNSEDIPIFAHALANFKCSTIAAPLAMIYKHDDSLRHNAVFAENVGLQLVEETFSADRIASELQTLKQPFLVQRLLSLSRVCYENQRHSQAKVFFIKALKLDWQVALKWSYFKKFLASCIYSAISRN